MAVSAKSFQLWRARTAPGESTADLCRRAGIKRSTLAQQLVRGKVSEAAVVAVARAYGLNPLAALAAFEEYQDLQRGSGLPTDAELISQISYVCILKALIERSINPGLDPGHLPDLCPFPHRNSVRAWFEAVDPGDLRQKVSAASGVAPQNLSAQLTANRLAPELAVQAARIAGVSLSSGLVVTGLLRPDEAGWPGRGRERALAALSDADLVLLARDRLDTLGKSLKKIEQDEVQSAVLMEHLG